MNPEEEANELEDLLQELLAGIQEIIQSGEVLSDEFQGYLAETLNRLTNRIDELRTQIGAGPIQTPEIPPGPHPSSNINGFNYDPKSGKLFVKFQDKYPGTNGPVYSYEGIPPYIFDIFKRGAVAPKTSGKNKWHTWKKGVTPSLGASMNALIKGGAFPYQKVS